MATYNDIIRLRESKPAYSLVDEGKYDWLSFIPHEQFNQVLRTVLRSVRNNNVDVHKSFWIDGTYGTGKSHAAAVVSHLLCDPVNHIREWVDYEYREEKFEQLRNAIYQLRQDRRLLCVKLYGLASMVRQTDLGAVLQQAVRHAAQRAGIELRVQTDFEALSAHIGQNPELWETMIASHPKLSTIVADGAHLRELLGKGDLGVYHAVTDALRDRQLNVTLSNERITQWLAEAQQCLRQQGTYQGLLIVWDEFTDVMKDAVGLGVLKQLQEVAERFMGQDSDSYLFLISHPSALDVVGQEVRKQTDGRYHRMKYNMESVSAFRIMSSKLRVVDDQRHAAMAQDFYGRVPQLLADLTAASNDAEQTAKDLRALYPLHPGTANLATHYATVVGSSSRSVFEFLGQNEAIDAFLSSPQHYLNGDVVTADYLWDYVLRELQSDPTRFGAVTERYFTHQMHANKAGAANEAIFKAVLLLNAFNNVSQEGNHGLVTPSAENVKRLFDGSQYGDMVDGALEWLHQGGIIQRAPDGLYSVQFSAFAATDLKNKNEEIRRTQFNYTHKIADFAADTVAEVVRKKLFPNVKRPYEHKCYSLVANDSTLRSMIKSGRSNALPSHWFFALLVGRTPQEVLALRAFAKQCADDTNDAGLRHVVYLVMDEPMTEQNYDQFIEYQTNLALATAHSFAEQAATHRAHAVGMVKDWWDAIARNTCYVYCQGTQMSTSAKHLSDIVNSSLAPMVYPHGAEAHDVLRQKSPGTFWKPQNSKEAVRTVLFATQRQDIINGANAQMRPLHFLFDDSVDENLQWKCDVPDSHPMRALANKVQSIVNHTTKSSTFNLADRMRELTEPPYGLYGSFANMGMLAFALRPWVGKIFDLQGKPRDANAMVDDIQQLFKVWDEGKSNNKLNFKFQTKEEGALCKELVSLFKLKGDITSLTEARFHITGDYLAKRGAPLWALKYTPASAFGGPADGYVVPEKVKPLIDDIVKLCDENADTRNPALLAETLDLLRHYRMDLGNMLGKAEAFAEGFNAYLVGLQPEHVNDGNIAQAREYLTKHLQSTIGYWTEEQVAGALKDWIISTMPKTTPTTPGDNDELHDEPTKPYNKPSEDKRERARQRVNNLEVLRDAREILLRLCDTGSEWVLDQIMR